MAVKLNDTYVKKFITEDELKAMQPEVDNALSLIHERNGAGSDFLGWVDLPENYDKEEFARIKIAAEKIKRSCEVFVVIGIGGSYLGARAAIEFVKSPLYNALKKDTPDIYFSGNNISSQSLKELLAICEGRDVCINVISKSGKTTEPAISFRVFREMLEKKYGEDGARERIFVTTDKEKGALKKLATDKGYETFVIPDDIGGRYSVLTAGGLLPIAVAGCDISAMMSGASDAKRDISEKDCVMCNDCYKYAALRNLLYRKDKAVEIFVGYEPSLDMMSEWWKQLYGESEGKDGKGILPDSVVFSTDLHSLGQIIQQGKRNIFETVLKIENIPAESDMAIPSDSENMDELNYITDQNLTLSQVNNVAFKATAIAHTEGGVPNIVLESDGMTEYDFGYLVYFFEMACAVSGYILGVNPFNQPGVEDYKNNMFALLGKKGELYDKIREALK